MRSHDGTSFRTGAGGATGKTYERIDGRLREWIEAQHMFFTATAPLAGDGTVNLSPKGLTGSFAVLDEQTVAYLDFAGSNAETVAHLRENGRITLMWCAFEGRSTSRRAWTASPVCRCRSRRCPGPSPAPRHCRPHHSTSAIPAPGLPKARCNRSHPRRGGRWGLGPPEIRDNGPHE